MSRCVGQPLSCRPCAGAAPSPQEGEGGRAAPNALRAWEAPEDVRPGQSWGAGGRGGRSPAPSHPLRINAPPGGGGRRSLWTSAAHPCPVPIPSPAAPSAPCRRGRPGRCRAYSVASPRGWAGGSGFASLPRERLRAGAAGRAGPGPVEGRRPGHPGLADAGAAPRSTGLRQAGSGGRDSGGAPRAPFPFPPSAAGGAGGFSPAAAPSLSPRHGRSPPAARDGREPEGEEPGRLAGQPGLGAAPQPQPPLLLPVAR